MTQTPYSFAGADGFVVEQYNDRAPFASFLPGIAGVSGRPAWVFYVNRGQAVASFGVRNKDGAFLEFNPADRAYQLTASRGFRTFLRITDSRGTVTHEPFQRGAGDAVRQRLYVTPHEVGVEEIHPGLGLAVRADVFTLPEAPLAGLIRRVRLENTSSRAIRIEVVDGLPQVLPYGLNQWVVKFMSRTVEAYMQVEGLEEDLPFYRLKVWPTDTPQVETVEGGHFFAGFLDGRRTRVLVDAERVFGPAADFSRPERFFSGDALDFARQVAGNQTPCAFQALTLALQPGESRVFHGLYGHAQSRQALAAFVRQAQEEGYLEDRREVNRRLVDAIMQRAFTATAKPLFDAHVRQCYLDNGLRGGFPTVVPGGARLHLFGRKHGDLERDYNDFLLADAPYSEGNGDFRDVLQNRRLDLFFEPALDARDIRYFFNLIQPDGYNPVSVRNSRFSVEAPGALAHLFARFPGLEARVQVRRAVAGAAVGDRRSRGGRRRDPGAGPGSGGRRIRPRLLVRPLDLPGRPARRLQGHLSGPARRSVPGEDLHLLRPHALRPAALPKIRADAPGGAPVRRRGGPQRQDRADRVASSAPLPGALARREGRRRDDDAAGQDPHPRGQQARLPGCLRRGHRDGGRPPRLVRCAERPARSLRRR